MKAFMILAFALALLPRLVFAKKDESKMEAVYVVPSPPELVSHSRFIVEIVEPFKGPETEKISYIFPEILVGEKDRVIELSRIEGTENSWTSDLITAHCTIIDDSFSCNVLVNKPEQQTWLDRIRSLALPKAYASVENLCQGHAVAHLSSMGLSRGDINNYTQIIGSFCSSEPAGFFSYKY